MSTPKKRWHDLGPTTRSVIIAGGAAELVLTSAALRDLARRPSSQVRGPKPLWVLACAVQPFGPLAYFWRGRRI